MMKSLDACAEGLTDRVASLQERVRALEIRLLDLERKIVCNVASVSEFGHEEQTSEHHRHEHEAQISEHHRHGTSLEQRFRQCTSPGLRPTVSEKFADLKTSLAFVEQRFKQQISEHHRHEEQISEHHRHETSVEQRSFLRGSAAGVLGVSLEYVALCSAVPKRAFACHQRHHVRPNSHVDDAVIRALPHAICRPTKLQVQPLLMLWGSRLPPLLVLHSIMTRHVHSMRVRPLMQGVAGVGCYFSSVLLQEMCVHVRWTPRKPAKML
jgi:hypothetical protein